MVSFDVIVVGAGHAGIEAALACARMGLRTACVTMRRDRIGHLPCNCSIGGPAKGHMAREVDALGGQMGVATDYAMTHLRRVGTRKGPAVQTLRAHVCKQLYPRLMRATVESQPGLDVIEATVLALRIGPDGVRGVETADGPLEARSVVLTTGTFLNGVCHEGRNQTSAARRGEAPSTHLADDLRALGVHMRRFKTGTTPRVAKSTLDLSRTEVLESEPEAGPFSFRHYRSFPVHPLLPCWRTRTSEDTHRIILENLEESAMFGGRIEGVGPRYCPSVEDKIVRFADKESHPIFLEQEEWEGESVYVQGMSTSLPASVQAAMVRTVPGMERAEILVPGYAVEYDMADPLQLLPSLMSKLLPGLFLAGQLNGTSGYEEAAGQGIVAGINAGRFAREAEPIHFSRSQSFLGVMIDDLVTKGVEDPYRMLTARAEHRLWLRHDNADVRLTPIGREAGIVSDEHWQRFEDKQRKVESGIEALQRTHRTPQDDPALTDRISLWEYLRRPGTSLDDLGALPELEDPKAREQIELRAKYQGYLQREDRIRERAERMEDLRIPDAFAYADLKGLSYETVDKLQRARPASIGQAARVPGVRPTDIALLVGHLRARRSPVA